MSHLLASEVGFHVSEIVFAEPVPLLLEDNLQLALDQFRGIAQVQTIVSLCAQVDLLYHILLHRKEATSVVYLDFLSSCLCGEPGVGGCLHREFAVSADYDLFGLTVAVLPLFDCDCAAITPIVEDELNFGCSLSDMGVSAACLRAD